MSKFLEDFKKFILENKENIYSIGEYKIGGDAEEAEIQQSNACNNIYSVAKVFTVTAVGMLVDMGLLETHELVPEILGGECPENFDSRWKKTTVDMLLRHRIGFPGGALDIDCIDATSFREDYLHEVMLLPWDIEPDTERRYTDGAFYVLSRIVAKRAGMPMQEFLWKKLFRPLGFRECAWSTCPKGHAIGATGLYIRSSDMVKLGAVYLQNGMWKNERILSEKWVKTVFEREYELSPVGETEAYHKGGMRGQNLMVIPSQGRVVGWIGHRRESGADFDKFIFEYKN